MKILVATTETQGQRKNDFCFVPEGELVHFGFECDSDENIDGRCGCRRSMVGIESSTGTTTVKIVNSKKTQKQITEELTSFYIDKWRMGKDKAQEMASMEVLDLICVTKTFPVNTILEKRGDMFQVRDI